MKASELEGALLDYWVAKAEDLAVDFRYSRYAPVDSRPPEREDEPFYAHVIEEGWAAYPEGFPRAFGPSIDWAQGGPLLARMIESGEYCVWENYECVTVSNHDPEGIPCKEPRREDVPEATGNAPTLLVAMCRALVMAKFGADVPEITIDAARLAGRDGEC